MGEWQVWRQDDNGNQFQVSAFEDRVQALARVLAFESGQVHKQLYWVTGPAGPVCHTNRDLYTRLVDLGRAMNTSGRTLGEFLRAWWLVSGPLADRTELDLDTVAAMVTAAATIEPPPLRPAWRTGSFALSGDEASYADWEAIVLSQIADLADFADAETLDEYASLGVDVERPPGCTRATDTRWYNFDPQTYLECGMAGSLGGWDDEDGLRIPVPGPVLLLGPEPEPGERALNALSWAELTDLAICGQEYE